MSRLSACLPEWNANDMELLEQAKRAQLHDDGMAEPTANAVCLAIASKELARHCRRPGHSRQSGWWDTGDVAQLEAAKLGRLTEEGVAEPRS
ncbi:hypothetical protein FJT64_018406 [Amphibalanus amphitrite]|uniref:Uncharacterized protein n=1 Tax=Amphibalanus amphitrite TaxID=1232801 RepID=A0A6A4X3E3_AMPAM|nr:hypothetical protein FJT64_018406 [Amphibalanus amphitrite]